LPGITSIELLSVNATSVSLEWSPPDAEGAVSGGVELVYALDVAVVSFLPPSPYTLTYADVC
jgi:hypothetical protein